MTDKSNIEQQYKTSLSGMENASADILMQAFEKKSVNGTLYVPKEYGMFICK